MWNVLVLGLISFFTDVSTEMVYPLIPLYLTASFGVTPALIGLIEGLAESLASLLKVAGGYWSDRWQKKRFLAFFGYGLGLVYKLMLVVAGSWTGVLLARVTDRLGKGIRTTPRDLLIADSCRQDLLGASFGVHKAMDMAGSALGIGIAYVVLTKSNSLENYRQLFLYAAIPAALGLFLFLFVKERKKVCLAPPQHFWKGAKDIGASLKLYLLVTFLFALGNSSNAFLLLRSKDLGFDEGGVILLYLLYTLTASVLSIPFGRRSDRVGRKPLLVGAYLIFSLVYLNFALGLGKGMIILAFVLYGVFTAMITGTERAYVVEIAPGELRGTLLGLQGTLGGIALLPASLIAGLLWNIFGPRAPFLFGSFLSLLAGLALLFFMKEGHLDKAQ